MNFTETKLGDAYILEIEKKEDERGFFARTYCKNEFCERGISFTPVQCNLSFNKYKHTLRGMHYQSSPHEEAKLVTCVRGAIYDVIIDIRDGSPTLNEWIAVELNPKNKKMLYIPEGFAHGFLTLEDNTEVSYLMSEYYHPDAGRGIHWNDPLFNIHWPAEAQVMSDKDRVWPFRNR